MVVELALASRAALPSGTHVGMDDSAARRGGAVNDGVSFSASGTEPSRGRWWGRGGGVHGILLVYCPLPNGTWITSLVVVAYIRHHEQAVGWLPIQRLQVRHVPLVAPEPGAALEDVHTRAVLPLFGTDGRKDRVARIRVSFCPSR